MNLFEELSLTLKPMNQNFDIPQECCDQNMKYVETFGHYEDRTYDHPGDWIEDYELYRCEICGNETKIFKR